MPEPVRKLWITLHRSFAGTKETHVRTAKALGFSKLQQTIAHPNTPTVRGAVDKVRSQVLQLRQPESVAFFLTRIVVPRSSTSSVWRQTSREKLDLLLRLLQLLQRAQ